MNKRLKIAIFLFCFIWLLTAVQFIFSPFKLVGLNGAFNDPEPPELTFENWKTGKFQKQTELYAKYNTPFRADFVRVKNQVGYSLFGEFNTNLTLGKDHYLFDHNYINAFLGKDLLPYKERMIQSSEIGVFKTILDSLGVKPFWIIAPNKARYYQEYLKEELNFESTSNPQVLKDLCYLNKIPVVDTDDWFGKTKNNSKYPLIPKYGAHWSVYGAALVCDSLDNLLEKEFPKKVKTSIGVIKESKKAKFSDDDYLPSINLIKKWEWDTIMGYPAMVYEPGLKLKALVVSDSYMWNLYYNDYFKQNFTADSQFLYYNKAYYNINKERTGEIKPGDITIEKLSEFETVIFITTGPSLKESYSYNFISDLLDE